jgi:hypothetical protein
MRRALSVAIVVAVVAVPASTAGTAAGAAYARQVGYLLNGQYDRLYNELAPQQRRHVSRSRFVACYEAGAPQGATLEKWKQFDTLRVRALIPGTKTVAWLTVVTLRLRYRMNGQVGEVTQTGRMLLEHGRWRWVFPASSMAAFRRHACPK